jgi:hypothetical protein
MAKCSATTDGFYATYSGSNLFSKGVSPRSVEALPPSTPANSLCTITAGEPQIEAIGTLAESRESLINDRSNVAIVTVRRYLLQSVFLMREVLIRIGFGGQLHVRHDYLWKAGNGLIAERTILVDPVDPEAEARDEEVLQEEMSKVEIVESTNSIEKTPFEMSPSGEF